MIALIVLRIITIIMLSANCVIAFKEKDWHDFTGWIGFLFSIIMLYLK